MIHKNNQLQDNPTAFSAWRILIVDADLHTAQRSALILQSAGIETRIVADPQQVLDHLHEYHPELILMDLALAKYNGQSLVKTILQQERHISTPIVFLSATLTREENNELNTQDSDLLSKRSDPQQLLTTIMTKLQRIRELPVDKMNYDKPTRTAIDREHFHAQLAATIHGLQSGNADNQVAVMCIDLGNLAPLRETLGIANTELVISDFSHFVLHHLKPHERLARLSDNTLVILLFRDSLQEFVEPFYASIEAHIARVDSHCVKLDTCIGINQINQDSLNTREVLSGAHTAVEIARHKAGEQRYHFYSPSLDKLVAIERHLFLKADLEHALKKKMFSLGFQPIISIQGATGEKFDVVVNREDRKGNKTVFEHFVSNAALCDVNARIDKAILENAIQHLVKQKQEHKKSIFYISVSTESILDNTLPKWLNQQLRIHQLSGKRLVFTITEEAASTHLRETRKFISSVSKFNCRACIELHHEGEHLDYLLDYLPHHFVKLGAAFTHDLDKDEELAGRIVKLVRNMRQRGRRAIAMHVENDHVLQILRDSGVDFIHGNYLQHPSEQPDFDFECQSLSVHAGTA